MSNTRVINRVLIANRGEIAVRIIQACRAMGMESVLACSIIDKYSLAARMATRIICIGPAAASESYLNISTLITSALETGCDALHPGYGFLAESEDLAQACLDHGIVFVGPTPDQILHMGNKLAARRLAREAGVPILPGSEHLRTYQEALDIADHIGYPLILKAAAGGGGRGMKIVSKRDDMEHLFASASAEARTAFGDDTLYLERYIPNARHIEVQVLGDHHSNLVHLGERDCSLQRRHQKVVEESPAPAISNTIRSSIREAALKLARGIHYRNAGTVEFVLDRDTNEFYFLEMNTRIQVEHPVSEVVTGIDIVQEQLRVASGESLRFTQDEVIFRGHAIECRINAEIPAENFRPCPGRITLWQSPTGPNIRMDTHCETGYEVPIYYDSMLAKLIVYGRDREEAITRMQRALEDCHIDGINTTLPFLRFVLTHSEFMAGRVSTRLVEQMIQEMTTSKAL